MNIYSSDGRDLRAEVQPYLQTDESILWLGQPYTTRSYRVNPGVLIFAIFWLCFAVFWTVGAATAGGVLGLFGIPFLLIGVGMVYFLLVGSKKQFQTTVYAVTDRRAIILYSDRRGTNCTAYVFSNLQTVTMERVQGTTGTVRFYTEPSYDRYGRRTRTFYSSNDIRYTFESIEGVQAVYRLIMDRVGQR